MSNPRLSTLVGVRRYISKTIARLEGDEITETRARCIGYLCQCLASVMKDAELEERIKKLEEVMEAKR